MKCHQCAKPAMFWIGDEQGRIPLCLDCNAKLQDILDRQQITLERLINHTSAELDMAVGLPGFTPKFPPRAPRAVIQGGAMTLNNITVRNSNVGVLNTGSIGRIDSAVGTMRSGGDGAAADAFKALAEGVINVEIDAETKNALLEIISVLTAEATVPAPERRKIAMRPLLADLATMCSGISGLVDLYGRFGPAIMSLFR